MLLTHLYWLGAPHPTARLGFIILHVHLEKAMFGTMMYLVCEVDISCKYSEPQTVLGSEYGI